MQHCVLNSAYLTLPPIPPIDLVHSVEPLFPYYSDGPLSLKPFALATYVSYLIYNTLVCGIFFLLAISTINHAAISHHEAISG
jgi:hypothetical protein